MPKTTKDLFLALADTIGGEEAEHIKTAIRNKPSTAGLMDQPMSDEEFESQLSKMTRTLPSLLAKMRGSEWMKSEEWGLN